MSAVRRLPDRSNRAALSSPYARSSRQSSWSLSTFLNYINPLRRRRSTEEEESLSSDEDLEVLDDAPQDLPAPSPAQRLVRRGQQLTENGVANGHAIPGPPRPPPQTSSSAPPPTGLPNVDFTFQVSSSASKNLDTVTDFLTSHANQHIAAEDVSHMVALIQQSKPGLSPSPSLSPTSAENHAHEHRYEEPFRFETRAATSPPRSKSPSVVPRALSAPRTLSRNPNGSYAWRGAGSARNHRTRNSYSSPAFRAPRITVSKRNSSSTEVPGNDAKRRKVDDHTSKAQASPAQGQISNPSVSQMNSTNQSLKPPPTVAPIRQRTPGLSKPTAPVVPSPLRQAWTGSSPSGSEPGSPKGQATPRQTETAKHVTELVNSLRSQDKVLDELRNPYELANPVKRPTVPKRKRQPSRKMATAAKSKEESTNLQMKGMSAHAIIEATLPEGSKRSRPPPELEKSSTITNERDDDAEDLPVPKRSKPQVNGHTAKETVDVDMQSPQVTAKDKKEKLPPIKVPAVPASSSQPSGASKALFGPKSSMPKEPSKLRFSMQPEPNSTPPSPGSESKVDAEGAPKSSISPSFTLTPPIALKPAVPETTKNNEVTPTTNFFSAFAPPPPAPVSAPVSIPTPSVAPMNAKDTAKSQSLVSLPSFTFTLPLSSAPVTSKAWDAAKAMSTASLPTFDLTKSVASPASLSKAGFDWSAAGMKPPAAPTGGGWTCDTCMLQNTASAATKCTFCEAPKSSAGPSKPAASFDWGTAGMKPSTGPKNGEWTCSQCALQNPASATSKCTVCDAPKSGGIAEPSKPTPTFDWGAAGMKPTAGLAPCEWVCNECTLKNPSTATTKCAICEAPKPGASVVKASEPAGFNWAAAGLKVPTAASTGEWACRTCGLQNPANATEKCTICDSARS